MKLLIYLYYHFGGCSVGYCLTTFSYTERTFCYFVQPFDSLSNKGKLHDKYFYVYLNTI